MLRRLVAIPTAVLMMSLLAACGDDSDNKSGGDAGKDDTESSAGSTCEYVETGDAAKDVDLPPGEPTVKGQLPATIATSAGDLAVTLDADAAPCTVGSFVSLAEQGYFDDTTCHRLVPSGIYVLQCGDPSASGMGGPGYNVPDELTGEEDYSAGALAMANTGSPDTGGSQFFVVYEDSNEGLEKLYTVFGRLDEASTKLVADVAADGNAADGVAPATPVDISGVTVE